MRSRSQKIFYTKSIVITLAIIAMLVFAQPPVLWVTPIALVLGYLFGKVTCGTHFKGWGIVVTILVFALVNFAHSLIDGIAVMGLSETVKFVAVYGHELIRQPLLYVIFLAMLEPFVMSRTTNIILSIIFVTGVWFLGYHFGSSLTAITSFISESMLLQGLWFFIGDIIHHLHDDYVHTFKKQH